MADEAEIVEEVIAAEPVAAAVEVAPEPEPAEPEPVAEATPEPVRAEVPKWTLERIGEETTRRQAAEDAARQANERAANLEEMIKRLQVDPAKPAEPVRQEARLDQSAIDRAASAQLFQRDLQNVSESGAKTYGQKWADAINALNAYGANTPEFVSSVMDVDPTKTHEIMFQIAQDGERAVALAKMTPTRRIAEITRMTMAQAEPKPVPAAEPAPKTAVSRAPAPKPALAPVSPSQDMDIGNPDHHEKMSDADFERAYKAKYMKRSA